MLWGGGYAAQAKDLVKKMFSMGEISIFVIYGKYVRLRLYRSVNLGDERLLQNVNSRYY